MAIFEIVIFIVVSLVGGELLHRWTTKRRLEKWIRRFEKSAVETVAKYKAKKGEL